MSEIQLPITFKVPLVRWVWFPFALLLVWYFKYEDSFFPLFLIAALCLIMATGLMTTSLNVDENGFNYSYLFFYFERSWTGIERVKLLIDKTNNTCLGIYSNEKMRLEINVSWMNMKKEDVRKFLTILKNKAPQAIIDLEVIEKFFS